MRNWSLQVLRLITIRPILFCVELRCELRLEAAACFFEPNLRAGYMSHHCVQALRPEYEQPEQKNEEDFCAEAHGSPPYSLIVGDAGARDSRLLVVGLHG